MLAARWFALVLSALPLACGDAAPSFGNGGFGGATSGAEVGAGGASAGAGGQGRTDASAGGSDASLGEDGGASGTSDTSTTDSGGSNASDTADDRRDTASDTAQEGPAPGADGPPNRQPCTSTFGTALTQVFGRLDGFLVSVIVPGQATCKPDNDHVYLQISMNHATYQIAANVHSTQGGPSGSDVFYLEKALAELPDGPWTEGWHTAKVTFDYVADAGVHASDFTSIPLSTLAARVETRLASVNHISVFATGFGPDGAHLVHRNETGHDGAIVTEPLSANPHALMFHFVNQSF